MKSIKAKIISAFLLVIFVAIILTTSIIVINLGVINRYKQINQNIIYEQQLKNNIWLLVEDVYNALKSNDYTGYSQRLSQIKTEEGILDIQFALPSANEETKLDYRSVKNTLSAIIDLTDQSKKNFEANGTIVGISDIFQEASADFNFVEQDTADLLFAEAENIANTAKDIQKIQNILTIIVLTTLFLSSIFLIIFAIIFAQKITDPLIKLSIVAKKIIDGNFEINVEERLLKRKDEIGSLSISFSTMVKKLREKIEDEKKEKSKVEETVRIRTKELSDEKARLLASIDSLSVGFILINPNNNIILSNHSLLKILDKQEPPQSMSELAKYFDQIDLMNSCKECVDFNKFIEIKEVPFAKKFLRILCAPVENIGENIGHVLLVEDITESKILERSKDEFFAVASHELRTPLTVIRDNSGMILGQSADKLTARDLKDMVSDINSESMRLLEIVNKFLEISSLEQNKIEIKKEIFDINNLITNVVKNLKIISDKKGLALEYDKPEIELPKVLADKNLTQEILDNLIGNAIKFTDKGKIEIRTEQEKGFVKIRVIDTGLGVSEHNQLLLFRKFQQAGEQILARDTSQGTGLGLYISQMLAQNMGGIIKLEKSILGVGSTFIFTIPVAV